MNNKLIVGVLCSILVSSILLPYFSLKPKENKTAMKIDLSKLINKTPLQVEEEPEEEKTLLINETIKPKKNLGGGGGSSKPKTNGGGGETPVNTKSEPYFYNQSVYLISYEDWFNVKEIVSEYNVHLFNSSLRNFTNFYNSSDPDLCFLDLHGQLDCQPDYYPLMSEIDVCVLVDIYNVSEIWIFSERGGNDKGESDQIHSNMAMGYENKRYWNFEDYGDMGFTDHSHYSQIDDLPICNETYVVYHYDVSRPMVSDIHRRTKDTWWAWLDTFPPEEPQIITTNRTKNQSADIKINETKEVLNETQEINSTIVNGTVYSNITG